MSKRVVVLGDVMLDVIVQPTAAIASTSDTSANIRVTRGGSGANFAIALRASGAEVSYVGAGGNDAAREMFENALLDADVTAQLESVDGWTGTVVAVVAPDGQRSMLTDRGVNSRLSEAFVAAQLEESFDHLHVSGYVLLDPATRAVGVNALALARTRGCTASVDVCSVAPLRDVTAPVFLDAVQSATSLFSNEEEALALSARHDVERALDVLAEMFDEVVITRGARGALGARGEERFRADAASGAVVDTTGAGDAATGAYLGARLDGGEPPAALLVAMEAASRVVGGLGALG